MDPGAPEASAGGRRGGAGGQRAQTGAHRRARTDRRAQTRGLMGRGGAGAGACGHRRALGAGESPDLCPRLCLCGVERTRMERTQNKREAVAGVRAAESEARCGERGEMRRVRLPADAWPGSADSMQKDAETALQQVVTVATGNGTGVDSERGEIKKVLCD